MLDFWDACHQFPDRAKQIAELTGAPQLAMEINDQNIIKDDSVQLPRHLCEHADHVKLKVEN